MLAATALGFTPLQSHVEGGGYAILLNGSCMKSAGQLIRPNGQVTVGSAVDAEIAAKLQREAAMRGITVSELLRELIVEVIARGLKGGQG